MLPRAILRLLTSPKQNSSSYYDISSSFAREMGVYVSLTTDGASLPLPTLPRAYVPLVGFKYRQRDRKQHLSWLPGLLGHKIYLG